MLSRIYPDFNHALSNSNILLCDGLLIWIALKIRYFDLEIQKITGRLLFQESLKIAINEDISCCAILPSEESQKRFISFAQKKKINLTGTFISPFLFRQKTEDYKLETFKSLNINLPFFLFIFVGAPKQEILGAQIKAKYPKAIVIPVGGVIEEVDLQNSIECKRKLAFSKFGLEWLYRLIRNPRRIWKRVFISSPIFLILILFKFIKYPIKRILVNLLK